MLRAIVPSWVGLEDAPLPSHPSRSNDAESDVCSGSVGGVTQISEIAIFDRSILTGNERPPYEWNEE